MYKSKKTSAKGTFAVELADNNNKSISISVYPPKVKAVNDLQQLNSDASIAELTDIIAAILNNNKENVVFASDFVGEIFDIEEISIFLEEFFDWVAECKKK